MHARDALKPAVKRALVVAGDVLRVPAACARRHRDDGRTLPVVLCWDAEPDLRVIERGAPGRFDGFEALLRRIEAMREQVAGMTGAPACFTWVLRMDPQLAETWGSPSWMAERYATELAGLESRGDELGVHTHTWRSDAGGHWVRDHDPAWEEHCADVGLRAFETAFGRPCRAHRGGDRHISGSMVRRLRDGGVAVDLTVEPDKPPEGPLAKGELATGLTADFRGVPLMPYRTNPDAFPAADPGSRSDPLLIPLGSTPRSRHRHARSLHLRLIPSLFALRLLRTMRMASPPVLAFALRTDPGSIDTWDIIRRNLEHLAGMPGTRFVTAGVAARELSAPL